MTFGGTGAFADVGSTDVEEAERQVDMGLDAGINLIDTADVYSSGLAEEIWARSCGARRDRALVATKVRMGMGRGRTTPACPATTSSPAARPACAAWAPITSTCTRCTSGTARRRSRRPARPRPPGRRGKGATWAPPTTPLAADEGAGHRRAADLVVSEEIDDSLQAREAEYELIPLAVDQGLGVLVWSPLAGGLLSGRCRNHQAPVGSRQLSDWASRWFMIPRACTTSWRS